MGNDLQEALEGELGYKGERGYSTYELAVQNGFEGTLEDYLDHYGVDLSNYVSTDDVVDNLTSDTTNYPLSAKQGKVLKTLVDDNSESILQKVNSSNFAVVSSSSKQWNYGDVININLPTEFTASNSFILSVRFEESAGAYGDTINYLYFPYQKGFRHNNSAETIDTFYVDTENQKIVINTLGIFPDSNFYYYGRFRVLLMKI